MNTSKLVPFTPAAYPQLEEGQKLYHVEEHKKIGQAIRSIEQVMVSMETAGTVASKAGAVVAADLPNGGWQVIHDTVGGTVKLYANIGGTLWSVALA